MMLRSNLSTLLLASFLFAFPLITGSPTGPTEEQNVLVNEGDNIRLPCIVDRLEGFVMLWKRGKDIITVASQIIDKRVRLDMVKNGNYLIIGQSTLEDAGA